VIGECMALGTGVTYTDIVTISDYEWLAVPAGSYEIGLREDAARALAVHTARREREAAAEDPDPLQPMREAARLAEMWGNADFLYAQLAHSMPAHRVTLAAYSITATPVTLADWTRFRIATGAEPRATYAGPIELAPEVPKPGQATTGVRWAEVDAFATWAGAALPTEAEWEVALRSPAGSLEPIVDAERFEWCADEFGPYPGADQIAFGRFAPPPGGWFATRVRRGGAIPGLPVTVVGRRGADPSLRLRDTAFRLVRR
jgi:hypothetical protein